MQQRTSQAELEHQHHQLQDLTKSKQHLQSQLAQIQDQLESVKNEHSSLSSPALVGKVLTRLVRCTTSIRTTPQRTRNPFVFGAIWYMFPVTFYIPSSWRFCIELRTALESYKAKADNYKSRLDASEIARTKAARGESQGPFSLFQLLTPLSPWFSPAISCWSRKNPNRTSRGE